MECKSICWPAKLKLSISLGSWDSICLPLSIPWSSMVAACPIISSESFLCGDALQIEGYKDSRWAWCVALFWTPCSRRGAVSIRASFISCSTRTDGFGSHPFDSPRCFGRLSEGMVGVNRFRRTEMFAWFVVLFVSALHACVSVIACSLPKSTKVWISLASKLPRKRPGLGCVGLLSPAWKHEHRSVSSSYTRDLTASGKHWVRKSGLRKHLLICAFACFLYLRHITPCLTHHRLDVITEITRRGQGLSSPVTCYNASWKQLENNLILMGK
jgi:hypothetical protein